jgi:prepilin-type N-terminal cleavage/methylation domain-containing protein
MGAQLRTLRKAQRGFSMVEMLVVVFVMLITAAIASPNIMQAVYNVRLRTSAGDLSGLMQQARMLAAKSNTPYDIRYTTLNGAQIAFIDLNLDGNYSSGEPLVQFSGTVVPAAGAPSGSGGQPSPYVLTGDSSTGSVFTNTSILGYSPRGLPCNWDTSTSPPTCSTPASNYFVYYLTDTRMGVPGWAGVVVTKSGRSKVVMWDGTTWH